MAQIPAEQVERLIVQGLRSFDGDPPDTEYQRGYRAALADLAKAAGIRMPEPETH